MRRMIAGLLMVVLLLTGCTKPTPKPEAEKQTATGTVVAVFDDSFMIRGLDGELEVLIQEDTLFLDRGGQALDDAELISGNKVTVTYASEEAQPTQVEGLIVVIESVISTQVGEGIGSLADCTEPPVCRLETSDGRQITITASSYDWTFPSGSGEMTSITACGMHPMDDPTSLPTIGGTDLLYLHFDYTPQSVIACYWSGDDFGNTDAQSQNIPCTATSLTMEPGLNCYELSVTWQADNGTGGTAYYLFTANTLPDRTE